MLGRVMAVNFMFTGTSGTLGEFRAGAVAALFGAFTSVLVGGIGAIAGGAALDAAVPGARQIDTIQSKRISRCGRRLQRDRRSRPAGIEHQPIRPQPTTSENSTPPAIAT